MDNFIVSARKYRPATFETVVGQQHITGTLKNAIKNNQLAQAFLFCGPRGVGKTTCARILAKTINCQKISADVEACGECESCRSFLQGSSFTIHELDAASNNSVDDIRSLIEQVRIPPQSGKYKIYIIDEVHMLSTQAFNAFLKTLEEPPAYAIFILATTEKHKILPTILSRCQIFDFNRIRVDDIANHLQRIAERESIGYDHDGLHLLAQKADGGLRDALSMFDQIVSFSNKQVSYQAVIDNLHILDYDYYFKIADAMLKEDGAVALLVFDQILTQGFDGGHFIAGLSSHFRNLLVGKDAGTIQLMEVSENIRQRYLQQSQQMDVGLLLSALNIANQCEINYRTSKNQRLQVELALLKMCHIAQAIQLSNSVPGQSEETKKKKSIQLLKRDNDVTDVPENSVPSVSFSVGEKAVEKESVDQNPVQQKKQEEAVRQKNPDRRDEQSLPEPTSDKPRFPNLKDLKLSSSIPSLKDVFKEQENEGDNGEPKYVSGSEREAFSYDAFLEIWHEFADQTKKEGKISLFTLMTANTPLLIDNYSVEVIVENTIQENLLQASKIDILNILRVRLRNFDIQLTAKQVEIPASRRPYTDQEKYQVLATKNPLVDKLRQELNLGFD